MAALICHPLELFHHQHLKGGPARLAEMTAAASEIKSGKEAPDRERARRRQLKVQTLVRKGRSHLILCNEQGDPCWGLESWRHPKEEAVTFLNRDQHHFQLSRTPSRLTTTDSRSHKAGLGQRPH